MSHLPNSAPSPHQITVHGAGGDVSGSVSGVLYTAFDADRAQSSFAIGSDASGAIADCNGTHHRDFAPSCTDSSQIVADAGNFLSEEAAPSREDRISMTSQLSQTDFPVVSLSNRSPTLAATQTSQIENQQFFGLRCDARNGGETSGSISLPAASTSVSLPERIGSMVTEAPSAGGHAGTSCPVQVAGVHTSEARYIRLENFDVNEKNCRRNQDQGRQKEIASEGDAVSGESEVATCSICMEPWTGAGTHQICSLACGHVFGRSCIKRWLKQSGKKYGKCPHCNRRAKLSHLRNLYVPHITIVEGENLCLSKELRKLQTENRELRVQNAKLLADVQQIQAFLTFLGSEECEILKSFKSAAQKHPKVLTVLSCLQQDLTFRGHPRKRPKVLSNHCFEPSRKRMECSEPLPVPFSAGKGIGFYCSNFTNLNSLAVPKSKQSSVASHVTHDASLPSHFCRKGSYFKERESACWNIPFDSSSRDWDNSGPGVYNLKHAVDIGSSCTSSSLCQVDGMSSESFFNLQAELHLEGAKFFDIDGFCQMILISQKILNSNSSFCLTKMSLLALSERESIHLPPGTGALRDIRMAPVDGRLPGRLALVASLGKKISIISLESNNVVLTYNLQSPVWSCSWDHSEPNRVYAGLQNGSLLVFDIRQTSFPLDSVRGLNSSPIHSLHYVCNYLPKQLPKGNNYGGRGILSASSAGPCFWSNSTSGGGEFWPHNLPNFDNQGVCASLAYNAVIDTAVTTFRQKPSPEAGLFNIDSLTNACNLSGVKRSIASQMGPSQVTDIGSQPCHATHLPMMRKLRAKTADANGVEWLWEQERAMSGYINHVGTPKSTIVCGLEIGCNLFAFGDEVTKRLWLWDMNNFAVLDHLQPHPSSILDVKNARVANQTILGCSSEKMLQIYTC